MGHMTLYSPFQPLSRDQLPAADLPKAARSPSRTRCTRPLTRLRSLAGNSGPGTSVIVFWQFLYHAAKSTLSQFETLASLQAQLIKILRLRNTLR